MAFEIAGDSISLTANSDLSTHQYKAVVQVAGARKCDLAGAAAGHVAGILQNKPAAGEEATVWTDGVSKAIAGAAITVPAYLTTDASGRVVTATTGQQYFAEAEVGCTAANQIIPIRLTRLGTAP